MATIAIDTYKIITRLQERGFTKDQAEALIAVVQEVDLSTFVTKADLQEFKVDLMKWLTGVLIAHGVATAELTVALVQLLN